MPRTTYTVVSTSTRYVLLRSRNACMIVRAIVRNYRM